MPEKQLITTQDPRMAVATSTQDGLFGSADRTKLGGIAEGATRNTTDNIRAAALSVERLPTDSIDSYPTGTTMFAVTGTGWPEANGVVQTNKVSINDNSQFYYGRNNNRYTRYWQGSIATPAWTSWQALGVDARSYINGLNPVYVSATEVRVTMGEAYIPGPNKVVTMTSQSIALSPTGFATNSWVYLYVVENTAGVGQIEMSTTEPSAPYAGTARTKTGDTFRRYIGELRVHQSTAGNWGRFHLMGELLFAVGGWAANMFANAMNTTTVVVSCSVVIPPTVDNVYIRWYNNDTTSFHQLSAPGWGPEITSIAPKGIVFMSCPTDSLRQIQGQYSVAPAAAGVFVIAQGYTRQR